MKYIGLDCHKQYDHATMINTETGEIKSKRLAHTTEEFRKFIGDKADTKIVIESCWDKTKNNQAQGFPCGDEDSCKESNK